MSVSLKKLWDDYGIAGILILIVGLYVLQQLYKWYLIVPLTVVQREDYSDIEKRVTNFEKHMLDVDKEQMMKSIKRL